MNLLYCFKWKSYKKLIINIIELNLRINIMSAELDRLNASVAALGVSVDAAVAKMGNVVVPVATAADLNAVSDALDVQKAKLDVAVGP
jgi:hypothetical protein